jgi:hypothetical protein
MDVKEMGWGGMYRFDLAQDSVWWRTVVNTVINICVP